MAGNREVVSSVFSMLLEDPRNALQVYNAVNHSHYEDAELVEMNTLDGGFCLTVRNDASFILDATLSLYEHQSTVCPNMPIRSLVYFTNIMERMLKERNVYGSTLVKIPIPKFVVFYNGEREQPEQYQYRLSDAFERPVEDPELELVCTVYNINNGKNEELLLNCPVLRDYMTFVTYFREYYRENGYENLEHAIELAIDRCIQEDVLRDFLMERRSEVVKVTKLDYTFERQLELERRDRLEEGRAEGFSTGLEAGRAAGRAEGRAEGRREGSILSMIETCRDFDVPYEEIKTRLMKKLGMDATEAEACMKQYW